MTYSWHHGLLAAFDLETTGVDVENDRIVTACVTLAGGGHETETYDWLADPGIEIPEEATEVHGVSTERARAEGGDAGEVVAAITGVLAGAVSRGVPVAAFNARFDLTVLDREARRHGITPLGNLVDLRVVDPLVIDKHINRYRPGSRTLVAICGFYRVRLDQAHAADSDAIAAARAAWVLAEKGTIVRRERDAQEAQEAAELRAEWAAVRYDLDALHEAQVRWAAYQAISLQEYFRGQGKPDVVEPAWPIVPLPAAEVAA